MIGAGADGGVVVREVLAARGSRNVEVLDGLVVLVEDVAGGVLAQAA